MKREQKAQIQSLETIFIVIVVILIIVFGLVFFSQASKDEQRQRVKKQTELSTVELAKFASSLPEVSCSIAQVDKDYCFDIRKAQAFATLFEEHKTLLAEYYFTQLGNANITIQQIYPQPQTIELYVNAFEPGVTANQQPAIVPITLYDSLSKEFTFGVLYITRYSR